MVLCTARPRCVSINDEKQIMRNNAGRNNDERDMNHQALKGHTTESKTITVIRMWRWVRRSRSGRYRGNWMHEQRSITLRNVPFALFKLPTINLQAENDRMFEEGADLVDAY